MNSPAILEIFTGTGGIATRGLIDELINAGELLSACEILKEIDEYLEENPAKRSAACKALIKAVRERASQLMSIYTFWKKPYAVYAPHFSVPLYLIAFGLSAKGGVKEVRQGVRRLVAHIDGEITVPSGRSLTMEQAEETLAEVTRLYPYFDIVGQGRPLTVLNLDNTNRTYNSLCTVGGLGEKSIILMFNLKPGADGDCSPVAVFLHELGHALHIAITGFADTPQEFYEFQKVFSRKLTPGDPMAGEVFADAFAISVMHGGSLQSHMSYEVEEVVAEIIKRFFASLFKKYAAKPDVTV